MKEKTVEQAIATPNRNTSVYLSVSNDDDDQQFETTRTADPMAITFEHGNYVVWLVDDKYNDLDMPASVETGESTLLQVSESLANAIADAVIRRRKLIGS